MFAYCLSLSVLYRFRRTGGQQLFRQTAKAHVDHIAEGLKNERLHVGPCQVSAKHGGGGEPFRVISVKNPALAQMRGII